MVTLKVGNMCMIVPVVSLTKNVWEEWVGRSTLLTKKRNHGKQITPTTHKIRPHTPQLHTHQGALHEKRQAARGVSRLTSLPCPASSHSRMRLACPTSPNGRVGTLPATRPRPFAIWRVSYVLASCQPATTVASQALIRATIRALACTQRSARLGCGYISLRQSAEALGRLSLLLHHGERGSWSLQRSRQPWSLRTRMLTLWKRHSLCFRGCLSCLSRNMLIKANTKIMEERVSIVSFASFFFLAVASGSSYTFAQ